MADHARRRWVGVAIAIALTVAIVLAASRYRPDDAPFTPRSLDEVVEHVAPGTGSDPAAEQLRTLEAALARAPNDGRLAASVARLHLDEARKTGDARRLSYAEAALAPWWSLPTPPLTILVLRATIKQTRHEFEPALVDLDTAVRLAPAEPQAWLTRATVLGVLARYDEARASCAHLRGTAPPIFEATCVAAIEGVTGGDDARRRLSLILVTPGLPLADAAWGQSVLGEASLYRGDVGNAERELRAALTADPSDVYTRGLLADVLLDTGRAAEVLPFVDAAEANEVLLLRRAIATHRLGTDEGKALRARLRAKTDELRARGDVTHRREEARLVLSVEDDPDTALPIAVANFQQQHEPWDARILLEAAAAVAAHAPARHDEAVLAAKPALEWAKKTGCAWPAIGTAVAALAAKGGAR